VRPLLAITFVFALALGGCSDLCGNEVAQTIASPSGKLKAVVFSRNCGATTGVNTQVSILRAEETLPNDGANTFISNGSVPIVVQWQNDKTIQISGLGDSAPIKQNRTVSGVEVSYAN
jgi:hypothetical protein